MKVAVADLYERYSAKYVIDEEGRVVNKGGSKEQVLIEEKTKSLWCRYCNYPPSYEIKVSER